MSPVPARRDQPDPGFACPMDHVVGVIETPRQLAAIFAALRRQGFPTSDIDVLDRRDVEAFHASGIRGTESEVKARYEQELRDGYLALKVRTPDPARVAEAALALHTHGARFINLFTCFTIRGWWPEGDFAQRLLGLGRSTVYDGRDIHAWSPRERCSGHWQPIG
jgi:hypothetical protein